MSPCVVDLNIVRNRHCTPERAIAAFRTVDSAACLFMLALAFAAEYEPWGANSTLISSFRRPGLWRAWLLWRFGFWGWMGWAVGAILLLGTAAIIRHEAHYEIGPVARDLSSRIEHSDWQYTF